MAYPFAQMPTVAEFIDRVTTEHRATLRHTESLVVGPKGPVTFDYLEMDGPEPKRTQPLPSDHQQRVTPQLLRVLCLQLGIQVQEFEGFELG